MFGNPKWMHCLIFKVIAPSHRKRTLQPVVESGGQDKNRVYKHAIEEGTFTTVIVYVDGPLHREA